LLKHTQTLLSNIFKYISWFIIVLIYYGFDFSGFGLRLCQVSGAFAELPSGEQPLLQQHRSPNQISAQTLTARQSMLPNVSLIVALGGWVCCRKKPSN
jgi:hypothetical protein